MSGPVRGAEWALFALLVLDAALLALLELFYLPLRLDGLILPRLGDVPVPVSVLVAVVTTPLLVAQAARLVRSRLALVPLAAWLVTLLVFGVLGPGGDLVLVADWRALALLAGGALPAAVVLGGALARLRTEAR
ncbi:hypothetical protein [Qaidamihabitans albus]|uniref:hypothetical protein n=1 Tax=Qaidamihabitans albus TaxID=2795733 RepID=UPI0018F243CA|nr:hypothetical protein [Qaidamihabitans albus]